MRRRVGLWLLALLLTLCSAVFQRLTGPTQPVRGTVTLGGAEIRLRLLRSHGGDGDQPVVVKVADPKVTGSVAWRRYPTNDPFVSLPMVREGDALKAALPHQPPAGKLEYQVRLARGGETALFPERPAITRFKGAVSAAILAPHIVTMFTGMLVANAAGLLALRGEKRLFRISLVVIALLLDRRPLPRAARPEGGVRRLLDRLAFRHRPDRQQDRRGRPRVGRRGVPRPRRPRRARRRRRRGGRDARRLHGPPQRVGLAGRLVEAPAAEVEAGRPAAAAALRPVDLLLTGTFHRLTSR